MKVERSTMSATVKSAQYAGGRRKRKNPPKGSYNRGGLGHTRRTLSKGRSGRAKSIDPLDHILQGIIREREILGREEWRRAQREARGVK